MRTIRACSLHTYKGRYYIIQCSVAVILAAEGRFVELSKKEKKYSAFCPVQIFITFYTVGEGPHVVVIYIHFTRRVRVHGLYILVTVLVFLNTFFYDYTGYTYTYNIIYTHYINQNKCLYFFIGEIKYTSKI